MRQCLKVNQVHQLHNGKLTNLVTGKSLKSVLFIKRLSHLLLSVLPQLVTSSDQQHVLHVTISVRLNAVKLF